MERLQGMNMQLIAGTYLGGFGLQQSREAAENVRQMSAEDLQTVMAMSESFLRVFRSLAIPVFSPREREELEITRRVFQMSGTKNRA